MGTVTAPPDGASEVSANGNSVTLSTNIAPNKRSSYTNYIWVAATSGGVPMGEYSDRASGVTLNSELSNNKECDVPWLFRQNYDCVAGCFFGQGLHIYLILYRLFDQVGHQNQLWWHSRSSLPSWSHCVQQMCMHACIHSIYCACTYVCMYSILFHSSFTSCSPITHVLSVCYSIDSINCVYSVYPGSCSVCPFDSPPGIEMVAAIYVCMAVDILCFFVKCIRSHSNWCHSLFKWMSVSSSHLDSSCPHTSSHSNSLSSEVPGTRWFPTDCHYNISGFLYTHWSCSCHNIHSQSGRTNPTWIWVSLLHTHSYNSQWWGILWCMHGVTRWLWHLDKYYVTVMLLLYSIH